MSSYGLLLMIVGFIQFKRYDQAADPQHYNLGEILMDFLLYFSQFDFKNRQIYCRKPDEEHLVSAMGITREVIQNKPADTVNVINYTNTFQDPTAVLTVLDPVRVANNVTKSTY
jgi:hypothetical protein